MTAVELKELRLQLKISLLEVAAHSGLPEGYLAQVEKGAVRPSVSDLDRIEKTLRFIEMEKLRPDDSGAR